MPRTPHQRKMESIRRKARSWVQNYVGLHVWLAAQDYKCARCGRALTADDKLSVDHVWPLWAGGSNLGNILLAHDKCNQTKGSKLPIDREIDMLQHVNNVLGFCAVMDLYWVGYEKISRNPPLRLRDKIYLALCKLMPYARVM